ncbi:uncharacterized protein [Epargyreus clarus]|uniref:uncharacterized protein n=1 Tax=Epargyreus clarus TaxID=520877 RepID=UPI003C2ED7BA
MNVPGTAGESSCKRQENGDSTMESERPLKKARFAWQVKGKYHLRNEIAETAKAPVAAVNDSDKAGSSSASTNDSNDIVGNTEQNLEILGDYLLKQDFNTLDSVITDTNKSILPSTSISPEKLPYPRYISSYNSTVNKSRSENASIPMSLVSPNYSEDQCIARWQARQMAKGFVDNTINRVLDSWMVAPLPTDMDNNRFLALDVAEFINNLPGDNSIENEGILMAISAHGLQNAPNAENTSSVEKNISSNTKDLFLSPPSSPISDEEATTEGITENKPSNSERGSSSEFDMSWSYTDDIRGSVNNDLTFFPDTSNSSYQCFSESNHPQTPNNEYEADENLNLNDNIIHNHYDFLDAAVTFAIQNKGLTSLGSDYG